MPIKTFECEMCGRELDNQHEYYKWENLVGREEVLCEECMDRILADIKCDALVTENDSYGEYIEATCGI